MYGDIVAEENSTRKVDIFGFETFVKSQQGIGIIFFMRTLQTMNVIYTAIYSAERSSESYFHKHTLKQLKRNIQCFIVLLFIVVAGISGKL